MKDEDAFLRADKCQRLLQIDTIIVSGVVRYAQVTQNNKLAISLQYLKKEVSDEIDFFVVQINMKACYKSIQWIWQGWSSIPKVNKKASLQCLYNMSKKQLDEVNFLLADIHQSFLQVDIIIDGHDETKKKEKKCCYCFCVLLWCKIFWDVKVLFIVTCFPHDLVLTNRQGYHKFHLIIHQKI